MDRHQDLTTIGRRVHRRNQGQVRLIQHLEDAGIRRHREALHQGLQNPQGANASRCLQDGDLGDQVRIGVAANLLNPSARGGRQC